MPKILSMNLINPLDPISNLYEIQSIEKSVKETQRRCQQNPGCGKLDRTRNLVSLTINCKEERENVRARGVETYKFKKT